MSSTVGCPGPRLKRASASLPRRSFPPCRLCPSRSILPRWAEPCVAWMSLDRFMPWWLTQTRARVHPQVHPAADGVPLWRDCDRLADDVQVAPALGQAAVALERRAATVPIHQVHGLARVVGGVDSGQPAAGPLLEGGLLAGRDCVPEFGDHRVTVDAPGVQRRVGPAHGVLDLGILTEQTGPATRRLPTGQLDQRVDAGPRDAGNHGAVVGTDPGLSWQGIGDPRPALPLIIKWGTGLDHRPPLRQEDILDHPVEAAGAAQPGHVPAALDDLCFRACEDPTPIDRGAVRAAARLAAIENLKAPQHPGALLTAAAEAPAPTDTVATLDRHRLPAPRHGGAGDDRVGPVRVDLVDALVRQPERDELADAIVGQVPADRTGALRQELYDAQVGQRVGLQAAQLVRDHQAVEAGSV